MRVREAFAAGHKAVCLQAVTGWGKTPTASHIAKGALSKGNRVLFMAHQDILIRQACQKLRTFEVPYGVIMAGRTPNFSAHVQVASVQTMMRRILKWRYEFELIIIDEAHRSIAQGYRDVIDAIPGARILGITGTPQRLDGRGLGVDAGGIYDHLITTESVSEMIQLGYLVEPVYYVSKDKLDLSGVKSRMGEFDDAELAPVVDTPVITGSAVAQYQKHALGLPTMTWCVNIEHAEHTAAAFNRAGIPTVVLTGKNTSEERDRYLAALSTGEIKNVCFAQLLIEGVDVPAVGCIIMLRPTKSLTAYLQVCGRGLRTDPQNAQKTQCLILDHAGLFFTHGPCDEEREWTLDGRPKGAKKKPRDNSGLLQCSQANCWRAFKVTEMKNGCCPGCGHPIKKARRGPDVVDGDLQRATKEDALRVRLAREREVKMADSLEELQAIAHNRGYDPKWAQIQWGFKERAQQRAKERWGT